MPIIDLVILRKQSNGTPTPAQSSEVEHKMDGFQACGCGRGMSDCLIHPSTPEKWIASQRVSLARILQRLEIKKELSQ